MAFLHKFLTFLNNLLLKVQSPILFRSSKILKLNQIAWLIKLFISELISEYLNIYFQICKENFSITTALLIMAVHPFLALYV